MPEHETICAVVVTYNRKQFLLECLESLLKQTHPLDAIYLIDNASTDGTPEILKENKYIKEVLNSQKEPIEIEHSISMLSEGNRNKQVKIRYVHMHENTGGAGGFYEGVKRGYEKGYDWLWLMDDDVEPRKNSLEIILNDLTLLDIKTIGGIASLKVDRAGEIQELHCGHLRLDKWKYSGLQESSYQSNEQIIKIDYSSFVGLLIPKKIIERIGYPRKDFFIWADDAEYCSRILEFGSIYLNKLSVVVHKDKLAKDYNLPVKGKAKDLWKRYYGIRNNIILYIKYRSNKILLFCEIPYLFLRELKSLVFYSDHKFIRFKLLALSYWHAITGITGRYIIPEKWVEKYG